MFKLVFKYKSLCLLRYIWIKFKDGNIFENLNFYGNFKYLGREYYCQKIKILYENLFFIWEKLFFYRDL